MTPKGQLQYFRSPVDGRLHPCAVCATDSSPDPKPLIIEVSLVEEVVSLVAEHTVF